MKYIEKIAMAVLIIGMLFTLGACAENGTEQTPSNAGEQTPTAIVTPTPEAPTPTPDSNLVTYKVKVVDEAGAPMKGVMVQLCLESCFPGVTGDDGVATFSKEAANYKVGIITLPAGYTYSSDVKEFYFEEGSTEMTITLVKAEA